MLLNLATEKASDVCCFKPLIMCHSEFQNKGTETECNAFNSLVYLNKSLASHILRCIQTDLKLFKYLITIRRNLSVDHLPRVIWVTGKADRTRIVQPKRWQKEGSHSLLLNLLVVEFLFTGCYSTNTCSKKVEETAPQEASCHSDTQTVISGEERKRCFIITQMWATNSNKCSWD